MDYSLFGVPTIGLPAVISLMTSVIALMMTHERFDPNSEVFIRGDDLYTGKHFCTCEDSRGGNVNNSGGSKVR